MKVQGSAFFFGNEAEAPETKFGHFFHWLHGLQSAGEWPPHRPFIQGYAYRRRMFVNDLNDSWCGVLLSARATEFHHYVRQQGDTVTVEARSTGPNPPVEINFFCLRKDSHKGLYSHYYGSYAFGSFQADLWNAYRHYVEQQRAQALATPQEGEDNDAIRQRFSLRGRAQYSALCNPNTFDQLVRELSAVFEVRLTTYSVDESSDRPVSDRIRNVHKVYRIEEGRQGVDRSLLSWISTKRNAAARELANGRTTFAGSVLGQDVNGEERTIPFGSLVDNQLDFDYDNIGSFNVQNLAANPCLEAMLSLVRQRRMFRPET